MPIKIKQYKCPHCKGTGMLTEKQTNKIRENSKKYAQKVYNAYKVSKTKIN